LSLSLVQQSLKRMLNTARAVRGRVADVDRRDLEGRGREMFRAAVELGRGQRMQHRDEAMRGVVGEMRVGGMALRAVDRQPAGHAAAPADLDHVAQRLRAGRLADEAGVEPLAARFEPFEHLAGPVDRRALLVTGNQQTDRTGEIRPALVEKGLHVDGAAAAQCPIAKRGGEGIERPGLHRARRHHVGVSGKTEIGAAAAAPGVEIVDPVAAVFAKDQPMAGKAELFQGPGDDIECAFVLGGDARPADQRCGDGRRVESGIVHSRSSSLIEVLARVPSSTFLTMTAQ
jgi:hypothetical protein